MRLYAVTEDNRLLSIKERADKVGPVVAKVEKPAALKEGEPVKIVKGVVEGAPKAEEKAAKVEEKKEEKKEEKPANK
jgi:hypothetical protein